MPLRGSKAMPFKLQFAGLLTKTNGLIFYLFYYTIGFLFFQGGIALIQKTSGEIPYKKPRAEAGILVKITT